MMGYIIYVKRNMNIMFLLHVLQDSKFPKDTGVNPHLAHVKTASAHLLRSGGFRLSQSFQAHSHAVSR